MTQVFDFHVRLVPRPGAAERLLEALEECEIDRAAVSAGGTIDPLTLSRQLVEGGHVDSEPDNDAVLRACADSAGRLVPCYFANPHRGVAEYRERAGEFRKLEISPAVHGIALTDPRLADWIAVAERFRHPVYVVCLARPGSGVADLVALAGRFPGVTFVLGHSGIGNIDFYGIELVAAAPNVLVETSGGYSTVAAAALRRLGPDRVLFGSEYPLQHPGVELAKFAALGLTDAQWRQVAWDNALRVLSEGGIAHDRDRDQAAPAG
ncbi:amidohydrolase family protein [Gandjariella thermophila]|uniref:Amidohydrolase-related domain-containing protein n=1 Tax=Gandjariella thermophila TaxID=1931992 RepID=A0A4D4JEJ6_9PSEU|nr:amidohydrolase family protein [Gandjariella thermophila]GDY32759.1 hypothetical protein GTS_43920 [Gandjariella thermophila]